MLSFYALLSMGLFPECSSTGWVSIRPWQNDQIFPVLTIICLTKQVRFFRRKWVHNLQLFLSWHLYLKLKNGRANYSLNLPTQPAERNPGRTGELAQWLKSFGAFMRTNVWFPVPTWSQSSITLLSEDWTPSSDLHRHQEWRWCMYTHADMTPIKQKANDYLKVKKQPGEKCQHLCWEADV